MQYFIYWNLMEVLQMNFFGLLDETHNHLLKNVPDVKRKIS